jgi:hypothetical protein
MDTENIDKRKVTTINLDKDFRHWLANERNKHIVERKVTRMSIEDFLKEKLGYVTIPSGN